MQNNGQYGKKTTDTFILCFTQASKLIFTHLIDIVYQHWYITRLLQQTHKYRQTHEFN